MEESYKTVELNLVKDNHRIELEQKIEEMRKTIEDIRQKVTEDREMLQKEKRANERLMEDVKLQRKLSMFHLPHCPAHSAPCPVHPFKKLSLHHVTNQYTTDYDDDLFHGDHSSSLHVNNDDLFHNDNVSQSYSELVQRLQPLNRQGSEDLFVLPDTAPSQAKTQPDNFTLLLSNQWQCRQQSKTKASQPFIEQRNHTNTTNDNYQFRSGGDTQYGITSNNFNNI